MIIDTIENISVAEKIRVSLRQDQSNYVFKIQDFQPDKQPVIQIIKCRTCEPNQQQPTRGYTPCLRTPHDAAFPFLWWVIPIMIPVIDRAPLLWAGCPILPLNCMGTCALLTGGQGVKKKEGTCLCYQCQAMLSNIYTGCEGKPPGSGPKV